MHAVRGWALLAAPFLAYQVAVHANTQSAVPNAYKATRPSLLRTWMELLHKQHASAAARVASYSYRQLRKDHACFMPTSLCGDELRGR